MQSCKGCTNGIEFCRVESLYEILYCKDRRTLLKILSKLEIPIINKAGYQWVSRIDFNTAFEKDKKENLVSASKTIMRSSLKDFT